MENSFCRASERASRRLARLAQLITSMQSAAPHNATSKSRDWVESSSRNPMTDAPTPSFSLGYCCRSRSAITVSSERAPASKTPGFSRPMPAR